MPPRLHEQREVLREHLRLACELYGDDGCTPRLRKHLVKYARLHPDHAEVRNALGRVRCVRDVERVLDRWYASDQDGVWGEETFAAASHG